MSADLGRRLGSALHNWIHSQGAVFYCPRLTRDGGYCFVNGSMQMKARVSTFTRRAILPISYSASCGFCERWRARWIIKTPASWTFVCIPPCFFVLEFTGPGARVSQLPYRDAVNAFGAQTLLIRMRETARVCTRGHSGAPRLAGDRKRQKNKPGHRGEGEKKILQYQLLLISIFVSLFRHSHVEDPNASGVYGRQRRAVYMRL